MANTSTFSLIAIGKWCDVSHAYNMVRNHHSEDGDFKLTSHTITMKTNESFIEIHGDGRWRGPLSLFSIFMKNLKLSGEYTDYESGQDFFKKVVWEDGEKTEEIDDVFISKEALKCIPLGDIAIDFVANDEISVNPSAEELFWNIGVTPEMIKKALEER